MAHNIISGHVTNNGYGPRTTYRHNDPRVSTRRKSPAVLRAFYALLITFVVITALGMIPAILGR